MIHIENWMNAYLQALRDTFGERAWFVGLQGSYGRGEATEASDIDMVLILDQLSVQDILSYNAMLDTLPCRQLTCGFLSGKEEILNWEPSDLFQFCNDTTPIKGSLDEILALVDADSVGRAIKIGACNIYHGCVHNMLHGKNEDVLRGLYKSAVFVIQAIVFQKTGRYIRHQKKLLDAVSAGDKTVVEISLALREGKPVNFATMSETLFTWAKGWVTQKC